ncbi:Cytochrome b561 domain-containing protein [Aphelenchoides fujianensis]|nr:Cytochrome b561 domain-containing protein [Aphelenchoides fujianensis]
MVAARLQQLMATIIHSIYRASHLFGLGAVAIVAFFDYEQQPSLRFKFHPICMALGMFFLNGEALMSFRALKAYPRYLIKALHAALHGVSVLIAIGGIKAVRDSHYFHKNAEGVHDPLPANQSLHAWMGASLATLYLLVWIGSMFLFYFPLTPGHVRAMALPYHRLGGIFSFVFATSTVGLGVLERLSWGLDCNSSGFCAESWLVRLFVAAVLLYAASVLSIVLSPYWTQKLVAKTESERVLEARKER